MKKAVQWLQDREKLLLARAKRVPYESFGSGGELALHFYLPKDFREGEPRPVLLFLHGGSWDRGNVVQFAPQALHYVERGAISALVEYRHAGSNPAGRPIDALMDVRSAVRYLRGHAEELHLDPGRIALVGAGAGANLAALIALGAPLLPAEARFKPAQSSVAAAVLVSALYDFSKEKPGFAACADAAEAREVSPGKHLAGDGAPLLLLHGNADRLVPIEEVTKFYSRLERKRKGCRLVEMEGRDRDFFNLNVDPLSYEIALSEIDRFLHTHGLLKIDPNDEGPHLISWRETDY